MMTLNDLFVKHGSDKGTYHSYGPMYDTLVTRCERMLEIGVKKGASLRAWQERFPQAEIWGLDVVNFDWPNKVIGDATDYRITCKVPHGFDVIIDDASHTVRDQLITLGLLWPNLRIGGLYVIEDISDLRCFDDLVRLHTHRGTHSQDDNAIVLQRKNSYPIHPGWIIACARNYA